MLSTDLMTDAFGRVQEAVHAVLVGAGPALLEYRADSEANTIAWLVWHLTRVQDNHVAVLIGEPQVWTAGGWQKRFNLPFAAGATGYGQDAAEVAAVRVGTDRCAATSTPCTNARSSLWAGCTKTTSAAWSIPGGPRR